MYKNFNDANLKIMKCPICEVDLVMSERSGVEIDYCPKCRGVWLDRGELDKIIEKNSVTSPAASIDKNYSRSDERPREDHDHDDHKSYDKYGNKKKKGGLLGEIFDF
jgi:Zn-finger nucleic acid-binding protein